MVWLRLGWLKSMTRIPANKQCSFSWWTRTGWNIPDLLMIFWFIFPVACCDVETQHLFFVFFGDDSHPSHRTISSLVSQISGWVSPQYWDGPMTSICFGMDWTHQAVLNLPDPGYESTFPGCMMCIPPFRMVPGVMVRFVWWSPQKIVFGSAHEEQVGLPFILMAM